jgi:hypothetical protein
MADYTVLQDAGASVVQLLFNELNSDPQTGGLIDATDKISQRSPKEIKDDNSPALLSVYLYRVVENPYVKNQFSVPGPGGLLRKPPLTLDLNYMITPLLKEPEDRQIVLGKVMKVLYDTPILQGSDLVPPLDAGEQPLRMTLNPVPLEEITKVWQAMELDYKLSVCYVARVTLLDSDRTSQSARVVERTATYGAKPI